MRRSEPVGFNLRCFPSSSPFGAKNSAVQYNVPSLLESSFSITPMTTYAFAFFAAFPSASVSALGTVTEFFQYVKKSRRPTSDREPTTAPNQNGRAHV